MWQNYKNSVFPKAEVVIGKNINAIPFHSNNKVDSETQDKADEKDQCHKNKRVGVERFECFRWLLLKWAVYRSDRFRFADVRNCFRYR